MKTKECTVCRYRMDFLFRVTILKRHDIRYFICDQCGLIQTEEPFWLDEAYDRAISILDTGILKRNNRISKRLACLLFFLFGRNGRHLDAGGGYGILTRMMRDVGFEFYWMDEHCENLFARGFEFDRVRIPYTAVTAFEVMEHVYDPVNFMKKHLSLAQTDNFIFSTMLYHGKKPETNWWYFTFETGQHISFYSSRTLSVMASELGMNLYSFGYLHVFSKKKMNPLTVRILLGPFSEVLFPIVRMLMGSKTMEDHEALKIKNEGGS